MWLCVRGVTGGFSGVWRFKSKEKGNFCNLMRSAAFCMVSSFCIQLKVRLHVFGLLF